VREEDQIHIAVCDQLRARAHSDVLWWHTANEGKRKPRQGRTLKRMGMLPGVSDFICIHGGEIFALELKAEGGRPTESQLEFQSRVRTAGGHAVVAEGLDEAIACLEAWRLLRGRAA